MHVGVGRLDGKDFVYLRSYFKKRFARLVCSCFYETITLYFLFVNFIVIIRNRVATLLSNYAVNLIFILSMESV